MKPTSISPSAGASGLARLTVLVVSVFAFLLTTAFAAESPGMKTVNAAMDAIAHYQAGQDSAPLVATTNAVIAAFDNPAGRAEIAKRLATILESKTATLQGKEFVCKKLYLIGGDAVVPALAKMLTNEKTADMARYALERMPGAKARDALLQALATTTGEVRVGIINSLGQRREAASVADLAKLVSDSDPATAGAALDALAKIGGPNALNAISAARAHAVPAVKAKADDAYLTCASALAASGKRDEAAKLFKAVYNPQDPSPSSIAAFLGLAAADGDQAAPTILQGFENNNWKFEAAAAEAVRTSKGSEVIKALGSHLASLSSSPQGLLIAALADRGDTAALPSITAAASSADPAVRLAALTALGRMGNASSVATLAKAAAGSNAAEADAASTSLSRIRGADVNRTIVKELAPSAAPVRAKLIQALAARDAVETVPDLLKVANDPDETVRVEAFTALASLAKPDQLSTLVKGLVDAQGDKTREEAETAVARVAQKITPAKGRAAAVLAALPGAKSQPKVEASLLRVLARIGDDSALDAVRAAAKDSNAEIREAAVRALASWPDDEVLNDLERIAANGKTDTDRVIALRGYLRVLTLPSNRSDAETLTKYETALRLATIPDETKTAISGLANVHDKRVKDVLKPYLANKEYAAEAQAALKHLANTSIVASASDNNDQAKLALDGKMNTRWTTGVAQHKGQWFQLDLGWDKTVNKITLDATPSPGDYPRGYEVYVSKSKADWGKPVATGKGKSPVTAITFAPTDGRYIRIVQTGSNPGLWWSIHEIKVDAQ